MTLQTQQKHKQGTLEAASLWSSEVTACFIKIHLKLLPPSNPSHEHLTLNMEHTTLVYTYLFTTHTNFFISNLHMSDLTHYCLYCILLFCCLCPVAVILLSFCHFNKFLVCTYLANKAHSHSLTLKGICYTPFLQDVIYGKPQVSPECVCEVSAQSTFTDHLLHHFGNAYSGRRSMLFSCMSL